MFSGRTRELDPSPEGIPSAVAPAMGVVTHGFPSGPRTPAMLACAHSLPRPTAQHQPLPALLIPLHCPVYTAPATLPRLHCPVCSHMDSLPHSVEGCLPAASSTVSSSVTRLRSPERPVRSVRFRRVSLLLWASRPPSLAQGRCVLASHHKPRFGTGRKLGEGRCWTNQKDQCPLHYSTQKESSKDFRRKMMGRQRRQS